MKISKAIIPAAGFGTRFLPATKSIPKALLPVLERPAIHFTVMEAAESGIDHITIVTSPKEKLVWEYFQQNRELEIELCNRNENRLLKEITDINKIADISYVTQEKRMGLGHAILMCKRSIGKHPFAVLLPDDLIFNELPTIGQMIDVFNEYTENILAVKSVPDEMIPKLGIIKSTRINDRISEISEMVEKPKLEDAPSNQAIIGRYILKPDILKHLEATAPGANQEIQLTDALKMAMGHEKTYGFLFPGTHFDLGNPYGLLNASIYRALTVGETVEQTEHIKKSLREIIQ